MLNGFRHRKIPVMRTLFFRPRPLSHRRSLFATSASAAAKQVLVVPIKTSAGADAGKATFKQGKKDLTIKLELKNLPFGEHARPHPRQAGLRCSGLQGRRRPPSILTRSSTGTAGIPWAITMAICPEHQHRRRPHWIGDLQDRLPVHDGGLSEQHPRERRHRHYGA